MPFTSVLVLIASGLISSKEKPFACDFGNCRATFGDPSSCARHRKETHRRIIPYRCPISGCRSRYVTARTLSVFVRPNNLLASNAVQLLRPISKSTASTLSTWILRLWHPPFYLFLLLFLAAGAHDRSSTTTSSQ